ncbi:hypothetical protein HEP84_49845 [Streptomyces sp. RLB1-33]|nr:hypothetical protein [Streptomyces sp. RLB1-33]QIY75885.1 hypothetical protein HEP84_49845 [Streptomyces sp. RLB1-33]
MARREQRRGVPLHGVGPRSAGRGLYGGNRSPAALRRAPRRVLTASRRRLTDLNARLIGTRTLTPQSAAELITSAPHTGDEADALLELAALCGYLQHALEIVVSLLRRRRHRAIASLVDDIKVSADPTDALRLCPFFDATYHHLPTDQARLLRLLALAPTRRFLLRDSDDASRGARADVAGACEEMPLLV